MDKCRTRVISSNYHFICSNVPVNNHNMIWQEAMTMHCFLQAVLDNNFWQSRLNETIRLVHYFWLDGRCQPMQQDWRVSRQLSCRLVSVFRFYFFFPWLVAPCVTSLSANCVCFWKEQARSACCKLSLSLWMKIMVCTLVALLLFASAQKQGQQTLL